MSRGEGRPTVPEAGAGGAPLSLEARQLVREFGPVTAVDGIDFSLERGELLALFGPNGAGKTSLLKLVAGLLKPTRGEIRFAGMAVRPDDAGWRRRVGVLSHETFLYGHLTVCENLRFYGDLYGLEDLQTRVDAALEGVLLLDRRHSLVRALSRGLRQRLALARTLLHGPEVVLLDEPYTGLDPHAALVLRDVLSGLKDGRRIVVLVTHHLTRGLELADRVAIQVRGRFAFQGARAEVDPSGFERFYREAVETAA